MQQLIHIGISSNISWRFCFQIRNVIPISELFSNLINSHVQQQAHWDRAPAQCAWTASCSGHWDGSQMDEQLLHHVHHWSFNLTVKRTLKIKKKVLVPHADTTWMNWVIKDPDKQLTSKKSRLSRKRWIYEMILDLCDTNSLILHIHH